MKFWNIIAALLFIAISICAPLVYAQSQTSISAQETQTQSTDERVTAFQLYQSGDIEGPIKLFRVAVKKNKYDIGSWHYLGLALQKQGKASDARKAHERAARLGDDLLTTQLSATSGAVDFNAILSKFHLQIEEAADSAQKYLELNPKKAKSEEWQERVAFLSDFVEINNKPVSSTSSQRIFAPGDVLQKARILTKPEAEYTDEARNHQVTGTVVLRAVLASDGRVRFVRPLISLPYGLTRNAMRAARKIKFVPAMINGRPASQYIQIEYNFNLY